MTLSTEQIETLLQQIGHTEDQEIDCEEMLTKAAAFVESIHRDAADLPAELRAVASHLRVCPECREEVELIIRGIADPAGGDRPPDQSSSPGRA